MSGFSSMLGYIVTFFLIVGVFISGLILYTNQIQLQKSVIDISTEKFILENNFNLDFFQPFNNSGKVSFYLENKGFNLILEKDNSYCFDLYIDNKYISKDKVALNLNKPLDGNYYSLQNKEIGIFNINLNEFDLSKTSVLKFVDCYGNSKSFVLNSTMFNYWDEDFLEKKEINIMNPSNYPMEEYQVLIELDNSNFNFSKSLDDLRFVSSLYENVVLDLNFDDFKQSLNDNSKYKNQVYLGNDNSIEVSDPTQFEGVLLGGLKFEGNDYLTIINDNSLEIPREFTFSTWVYWEGDGATKQYLYVNGNSRNSIAIINDGGVNHRKIEFNLDISGVSRTIYSNQQISDGWNFITCTYDGETLKIFIGDKMVASVIYVGDITTFTNNNYIGQNGALGNFYTGLIDELKVFNIALKDEEISNLYKNNLRFRELDYYILEKDVSNEIANIYVKIPFVNVNDNVKIQMYYDKNKFNLDGSKSSIEKTFSYNSPNLVSFVVSDRIASTTGISIMSMKDENNIVVGSNEFNFDKFQRTTIGTASININDKVRLKYLAQVEGNGNAVDVLTPISWAGTEFYYRGFRAGTDRFCMLAPFGTTNVQIRDNNALRWSGNVGINGLCINANIATANTMSLVSNLPVLVHYVGPNNNDAMPLFPATSKDLYGSPSQTLYVAAGPMGANTNWINSNGASGSNNLGALGNFNNGGNGANGDTPAFKISSNNLIGAIQQADADGTESTVFVSKDEFGTLFGSGLNADYISVVSDVSDANCTIYDSSENIIGTQVNGVGLNGIYKYNFGVGNNNLYVSGSWTLECEKPVWAYYEERTNGDETNMWSYLQMRQYVYPEPVIIFD